MPGALTPAEIFNAWQAGADMIKIFPVSALGGILSESRQSSFSAI